MRTLRSTTLFVVGLLAVLLSAVPVAGAQELPPGGTFDDDDQSIHEGAIEAMVAAGITEGCRGDLYCPTDDVTRAQMATFLVRALDDALDPATRDWFPDDEDSIHEANIDVIAENDIAVGYPDGTFGPEDPVTRGQIATFLVRALDNLDPATRDWFPDDEDSIHEANINVIAENGITLGYGDGTYRPMTTISRAEMATMLMRALGLDPIEPPPRVEVAAYFFMESVTEDPFGPGPFLVPVAREIADPDAPATPTVEFLLSGPTAAERQGTPSIASEIPEGTELLGIVVSDGVATVDLSTEFESGGGSFSMLGRVAQVVYTLTQFPTVDSVEFEIEGTAVDVLGGEGILLDGYRTRDDFLGSDLLPAIFVDRPAHGGRSEDPLRLVGVAAVFEAQFTATVVDGDGLILTERNILAQGDQTTTTDGATWTEFDVTLDYDVDFWQTGAIIVFDTSARDGSQIAVREYPIVLVPSR